MDKQILISTLGTFLFMFSILGMLITLCLFIEILKGRSSDLKFVRYYAELKSLIKSFKKQHPDFSLGFNANCIKYCDIKKYNLKHPNNQINTDDYFFDSRTYFDSKLNTYSVKYKFLPDSIDAGLIAVSPFVNM